MDHNISHSLIKKIRARREELGYSQEYMAMKLDVKQNCYSKLELGKIKLTVDRFLHIFRLLDLFTEDFFGPRKNKSSDFSKFFYLNNQPMWLFEPCGLKFLEVNDATVKNYGYSKSDFSNMTLCDIRPSKEVNWLRAEATTLNANNPYINFSIHKNREGIAKEVLVNCYPVMHNNGQAYLVKAEIAPKAMSNAEKVHKDIFALNNVRNVGNGRNRSHFAELRFLAGKLKVNLPASSQADLLVQIQVLLDTINVG